jgi:hypothetical protein
MDDAPASILDRLAPIGVGAALVLFVLASAQYPGGYDWVGQSISALFQPEARGGVANAARPAAVLAVLVFCGSMAWVFWRVSRGASPGPQRKGIEIGGVGAMVYAAVAVTPMHDLAILLALGFFVVAMASALSLVYRIHRSLFVLGVVSLAVPVASYVLFQAGAGHSPLVQKAALVLWAGWILVVQRACAPPRAAA